MSNTETTTETTTITVNFRMPKNQTSKAIKALKTAGFRFDGGDKTWTLDGELRPSRFHSHDHIAHFIGTGTLKQVEA